MKKTDLVFDFPPELVALSPKNPSRIMVCNTQDTEPYEISMTQLIDSIPSGDVFVINDTKVLKRRLFCQHNGVELEILFLDRIDHEHWLVLFPAKEIKISEQIQISRFHTLTLIEKGLPQKVKVVPHLSESDFESLAELPLPPYIQKARGNRHNQPQDHIWYQSAWAENPGSFAAPTASLHFTTKDLLHLEKKGVVVVKLTLHVGLGTFLPVKVDDLNEHKMHSEYYSITQKVWDVILDAKKNQRGIWCLGTTVVRTLETVARTNQLQGLSDLLLQTGSEFKITNRLLTNFHQPESTLLALVSGFSSLSHVKKCYQWAIEKKFRLFSYGDLSVWIKPIKKINS